jgi:transposase-like protein
MGIKRHFSKEFKLSVLKELETKRLAEVCRAHNLAASTVCGWRNDYEANPREAFKGHGSIWKEDARTLAGKIDEIMWDSECGCWLALTARKEITSISRP